MLAWTTLLNLLVVLCLWHQPALTGNSIHDHEDGQTGSELYPTPDVGTKNVTAHYCPFPCTVGNETLCYPPPCPPPACVDPTRIQPTDCCVICPNGPDCSSPDGKVIVYDHWRIVGSKNCTCLYPGQEAKCI